MGAFEDLAAALGEDVVFIRLREDLEIERTLEGSERRFTLPAATPLPLTLLGAQALAEDPRVFPMPALVQGLLLVLEREEVLDSGLDALPVYRAFALTMAEDVVQSAENELKDALAKQDWVRVAARAVFLLNLADEPDRRHYAPLWLALGWAARHLGRLEDAVRRLERGLKADPEQGDAQAELGTCLARLGRLEEARGRLLEARRLQPELAVLYNLVQVCRQLGLDEESKAYLEEAEKLAPGDERLSKLRADLA